MCGIFGIYGTPDAAALTKVALLHLQHRGQEAAGISSFDGVQMHRERGGGSVDAFFSEEVLKKLPGNAAIGHVLYSTSRDEGSDTMPLERRAQPFQGWFSFGPLAIAHNGNLTNAKELRRRILGKGGYFQEGGYVDTEIALTAISGAHGKSLLKRLKHALPSLEGAYSFIILSKKKMIGVCDPLGMRPLILGRLNGAFLLSSETCALDAIQAERIRDIEPGEIVIIEDGRVQSHRFSEEKKGCGARPCIFEFIYFSLPNSAWRGKSVYDVREALGTELAREAPAEADVVIPMPDSGNIAALAYAYESRLPFKFGITRLHRPGTPGRSFIQRYQDERDKIVHLKTSPVRAVIEGKRVVLVDDSVVRGTTARRTVRWLIEDYGAREVHLRIASPPWRYGCHYGIDEKDPEARIAKPHDSIEKVCDRLKELTGATSVGYLSVDGMYRAIYGEKRNRGCSQSCDACFTGDFPTSLTDMRDVG